MQTLEQLKQYGVIFCTERPTIGEKQLTDPQVTLERAMMEGQELLEALQGGNEQEILDEYTDFLNFVATMMHVFETQFGFKPDQVKDHSRYKYQIRNGLKYPKEHYQEGDGDKQLKDDINRWAFYAFLHGKPEIGLGGEYY